MYSENILLIDLSRECPKVDKQKVQDRKPHVYSSDGETVTKPGQTYVESENFDIIDQRIVPKE